MSFELFAFAGNPLHLLIVAAIAFLLFGNRLPSVMRSLGRSVTEFKKGVAGIEEEVDSAVKAEPAKKTSSKDAADDKSEE